MRDYDRLLMRGIWAQIDIRHQYDEEANRATRYHVTPETRKPRL